MAFIHRFGSSLNEHVHFHVCVVDGVFEANESGVICHPASGIDATVVAQAQATLRRRILRAFGVLAPNSPLRAAVTAMAQAATGHGAGR